MKAIEFRTRVDNKGNIVIPEHIQLKDNKGSLVQVTVFDDGVKEVNGKILNIGTTKQDRKNFWTQYELDGVWNGE